MPRHTYFGNELLKLLNDTMLYVQLKKKKGKKLRTDYVTGRNVLKRGLSLLQAFKGVFKAYLNCVVMLLIVSQVHIRTSPRAPSKPE